MNGGAKRLREGCLKDIDSGNPFTPPPSPGAGAKTQREARVFSRAHSQHTQECANALGDVQREVCVKARAIYMHAAVEVVSVFLRERVFLQLFLSGK